MLTDYIFTEYIVNIYTLYWAMVFSTAVTGETELLLDGRRVKNVQRRCPGLCALQAMALGSPVTDDNAVLYRHWCVHLSPVLPQSDSRWWASLVQTSYIINNTRHLETGWQYYRGMFTVNLLHLTWFEWKLSYGQVNAPEIDCTGTDSTDMKGISKGGGGHFSSELWVDYQVEAIKSSS